ncbi:putative mitochondrial carrier protein [Helianthus annuus]|nr:putative mitochondrial carrier protein [Helianthus annuus]
MNEQAYHPSVSQKIAGSPLASSITQLHASDHHGFKQPYLYPSKNYTNAPFQYPMQPQSILQPSPDYVQDLPKKGLERFKIDFLIGGVSAAVLKTIFAPLEGSVLLIENQFEMIKAGLLSHSYRSVGDCIARTIRDGGLVSLWRGNTANVIHSFTKQASKTNFKNLVGLSFAFKDYFKKLFNIKKDIDGKSTSFACNLASGGAAGAASSFFVYSLDHARFVLENDAKAAMKGGRGRQFNGLIDVYKKTLTTNGIVGLYRRFNISCVGAIVYYGLYFGLYDTLEPALVNVDLQDSFFARLCMGWHITNLAGHASYPIETLRRRMLMTSGQAVKFKNPIDVFFDIVMNEGAKSLFKGVSSVPARAIVGAGVIAGYDGLQKLIFGKTYGSKVYLEHVLS